MASRSTWWTWPTLPGHTTPTLTAKSTSSCASARCWCSSRCGAAPPAAIGQLPGTDHANFVPPAIGRWWPEQGGIYAGVACGTEGAPDHHLVLGQPRVEGQLGWHAAMAWARSIVMRGFADWQLPSAAESALLFASLRECFDRGWHWTSDTPLIDGMAFAQDFSDGYQARHCKTANFRTRAVRRVPTQPVAQP